ncbi:hypothetical protein DNJ95_12720 [Stutzerimonas kirkiae]|uniref:Uncharacterized protein n=1 Tax=Stutzerimonas kirkiae TaxID=2211392 RepID=A0A4V2KCB0_9GAMM|nr:hypothetical protein [Stutzerimonas kirkiae]TBU92869.1 hypothetical protein DNJ96_14775 [Stutzerimonas kirkiae]TBV01332.1 hypothetical protein DNJ95_12720 [Stutzerimonas kirkiae]
MRFFVFAWLRQVRSAGRNLKSVLLVCAEGSSTAEYYRKRSLHEDGFRIASSLVHDRSEQWLDTLVKDADRHGVHEVWLCLPLSEGGGVRSIMYALRHRTVAVRFFPEWGDLPLLNHRVSNIAGLYSLDLSCSPMDGPPRVIKRMEGRRQKLSATPDLSGTVLPLCFIPNSALKSAPPFKSVMPKASACVGLPA